MNEFRQVYSTTDYEIASKLLAEGWELIKILSIKEHENLIREKYILGTNKKMEVE